MRKYLLQKSSSSVDLFILNIFSAKKVAFPRSNCPKELPVLKKWLLGWSFALKMQLFWKGSCCEEVTVLKKDLLKKSSYSVDKAAPKKINSRVEAVTLKKCEELASPKIGLPWKSRNICEKGNCHLKRNPNLNSAYVELKLFFPIGSLTQIIIHGKSHSRPEEIIRSYLCHTIFINC